MTLDEIKVVANKIAEGYKKAEAHGQNTEDFVDMCHTIVTCSE